MCDELMFVGQMFEFDFVNKRYAAMRQPEGSQVEKSDKTCSLLIVSVLLVGSSVGLTYRSVVGNASRFATAPDVTQIKHYHTYVV